jgi:hypothetical protein
VGKAGKADFAGHFPIALATAGFPTSSVLPGLGGGAAGRDQGVPRRSRAMDPHGDKLSLNPERCTFCLDPGPGGEAGGPRPRPNRGDENPPGDGAYEQIRRNDRIGPVRAHHLYKTYSWTSESTTADQAGRHGAVICRRFGVDRRHPVPANLRVNLRLEDIGFQTCWCRLNLAGPGAITPRS